MEGLSRMDRVLQASRQEWIDRKVSSERLCYERSLFRMFTSRMGITDVHFNTNFHFDLKDELAHTFGWLLDGFNDFPVHINVQVITRPNIADFFRPRLKKNTLWVPWKEMLETIVPQGDRALAMMFKATDAEHLPPMVMHTGSWCIHTTEPFAMCEFRDHVVTMESIDQFVSRILTVWQPPSS